MRKVFNTEAYAWVKATMLTIPRLNIVNSKVSEEELTVNYFLKSKHMMNNENSGDSFKELSRSESLNWLDRISNMSVSEKGVYHIDLYNLMQKELRHLIYVNRLIRDIGTCKLGNIELRRTEKFIQFICVKFGLCEFLNIEMDCEPDNYIAQFLLAYCYRRSVYGSREQSVTEAYNIVTSDKFRMTMEKDYHFNNKIEEVC